MYMQSTHTNSWAFALTHECAWETRARRVLMAGILLFAVGYVYCVAGSILNVIARKEADARSIALTASIAELEARYVALSARIHESEIATHGLSALAAKDFVTRTPALGLSTHDAR